MSAVVRLWRGAYGALPAIPALALLGVFFVYPVGALLSLSLWGADGGLSAEHYARLAASPVYVNVIGITLRIALYVTLLCLLIGYPLCLFIAAASPARKRLVLLCVLIPFWTSFLVRTFAWIVLLGRNGTVNDTLMFVGVISQPLPLIYNNFSLMVGLVHAMLPLAVLTMLPVIINIDRNLSQAGAILGGGGAQVFWRIFFPLSLPGVAAAGVLVFVTCLGFFITPALLGGAGQTMISQIIIRQVLELLNWPFAGALSMMLLAATALVLVVYARVFGIGTLVGNPGTEVHAARSSASTAPEKLRVPFQVRFFGALADVFQAIGDRLSQVIGRPRTGTKRVQGGLSWLILGYLVLPSLILVPISFSQATLLSWPPEGFTFRWYEQFVSSRDWLHSALYSLWIGILVGLISVAGGTAAAFAIVRDKVPAKGLFLGIALAPLIIPRVIIGVALMYFFARLQLVDTVTSIVLGHAVLALPYALITMLAVLRDYNFNLDQAAWTLGAGSFRTFVRITFPIIFPALLTAFVFAFITSFDDVTISLFLSGSSVVTLPKRMWSEAFLQVTPLLAAVSTISILAVVLLLVTPELLKLRRR